MSTPDPLREELDRLQRAHQARSRADARMKAESRVERMRTDARAFRRFLGQLLVAALWVWDHVLSPIRNAIWTVFRWVFRQYRKLWSLAVYRRDAVGTLRLSKVRAGLMLLGTGLFLWGVVAIAGFVFDATVYLFTAKQDEVIYLTTSEEVDAAGNVHSVKGCDNLPCSDADSVYFRINPSGFNHVWSFFDDGSLFYPDYVAAAVPPGLNRCTITSYGIRVKFLMRGFDIYPELLRASCEPVTPPSGG